MPTANVECTARTIPLAELLDGPKTRVELGATKYALRAALDDGLIMGVDRPVGGARGFHYKLTPKGRRRARK